MPPSSAGAASLTITAAQVNGMDRAGFIQRFGAVFENSPWVAEQAWASRPFVDRAALHAAMCDAVRNAPRTRQLELLRAHPDLAGRAARAGTLSASSVTEQASAGLDRLNDEEYERFARLNAAYTATFGFPFVIAVRRHDKAAILAAFERRLLHTKDVEIAAALDQVFEITRLRLDALVAP